MITAAPAAAWRSRPWIDIALIVVTAILLATCVSVTPASAAFGIAAFDGQVNADAAGDPFTQAGGHPFDASTVYSVNTTTDFSGYIVADGGQVKDVSVDLPPGFIGNPQAMPKCPDVVTLLAECPVSTQVGYVEVNSSIGFPFTFPLTFPLYNMIPGPGKAAQFGFNANSYPVILTGRVRSDGDYGVTIDARKIPQGLVVLSTKVTFWGVPADPIHDADRGTRFDGFTSVCANNPDPACTNSVDVALKAMVSNPTSCTPPGVGLETRLSASSWDAGQSTVASSFVSHNPPGYPLPSDQWGSEQGPTGCDQVPFTPLVAAKPSSSEANSPTGLDVEISIPSDGLLNPTGISQSHLKKAVVTLPEGMAVNPSAADGLDACSPAQIGLLGRNFPAPNPIRFSAESDSCPDASKIGTVSIDTPLLEDSVDGSVYLAQQGNRPGQGSNPFDSLLALYIVAESKERGVLIKLPGRVDADPQTGQLRATFDNNPQLPFSNLRVEIKTGSRAPLVTPPACGTHEITSELYPWARPNDPVTLTSSFAIDEGCGSRGFAPDWSAGSVSPVAGAFSPFVASFSRGDREQRFDRVSVAMPSGVLAKLAGVPLCGDAQAAAGTCPAGSRVGSATAGAGAGPNPFYLQSQPVYLTGPYKGAPYGLAVVVRVLAGPFDLGTVVVRQAIHIDPETAEVSIVSDSLPRILEGIPLNIRDVRVEVDRPDFTINPTSCAEKAVAATLTSTAGGISQPSSRFQVGDCSALAFKPKLGMRLVGRKKMRSGGHPVLRASVSQGAGQANIRAAKVTLPPNVVLDSRNSVDPNLLCGYDASLRADCPASSIIGKASLRTPLLNRRLSGPVHFVQGIRFEDGNRIRTLPTLLIKLRGEVSINLRSRTNTDGKNRLVSMFPSVPDARAGRFNLQINGGRKGILVVTENRRGRINLCNRRQTALVEADGHNGKRADYPIRVKTPCAKRSKKARKGARRRR